jgi:HD-GYP domain-containing protein (c-di-GMP phosphodiesterase class II)
MYQKVNVKLHNLLLSLSDALDLASPQLSQHQLRTAFIAGEIGKIAGIPADNETDLFIAALLHDVGALTPEEKLDVRNGEMDNTENHCILSEKFLSRVAMFETASKIVSHHHTNWSELTNLEEPNLAFLSQIVNLADTIERNIDREKYILHQDQAITNTVCSMSGVEFQPEIVEMFRSISGHEDFWLDLTSPRLYSILLNNGVCRGIEIDIAHLLPISEIFRDMIDFRSRFTSTHTSGVASTASTLSRLFGFTESEVVLMEVAGNFHDLGKMAIPNSILTKPGKLTEEEFAVIRQHTYYTYSILNTIGGIQHIAEWAAFHHERLDGTGYPFHVDAKNLSINARIMAVADIFTALAEARPYREPMNQNDVLSTLQKLCARNWLDGSIVRLLEENYAEVVEITKKKQAQTESYYEQEFPLESHV